MSFLCGKSEIKLNAMAICIRIGCWLVALSYSFPHILETYLDYTKKIKVIWIIMRWMGAGLILDTGFIALCTVFDGIEEETK
jgi:hypothetical protein